MSLGLVLPCTVAVIGVVFVSAAAVFVVVAGGGEGGSAKDWSGATCGYRARGRTVLLCTFRDPNENNQHPVGNEKQTILSFSRQEKAKQARKNQEAMLQALLIATYFV